MPFIGKQGTSSNSKITKYVTTVGASGEDEFSVSVNTGSDEVQVFLNGVLLKETTDYTLSDTLVTLGSNAVENDIVEIHVYRSFILADAVKGTGDTMTGELVVDADLTVDTNTLKVDATNNAVGIGQTSNLAKLTVNSGGDNVGIALHSTDSGSYMGFADNTTTLDSSTFPYVQVGASGNDLVFGTNNTAQMRVKSDGNINFEDNTDAKIILPSAGGIYESDGSTPIITESSGVVSFPAGHVIQTVHEFGETATNITSSTYSSPTYGNITATITPSSSTNKLFIFGYATVRTSASGDVGYMLVMTKTVGASTDDIYSSADIDGNLVDDTTSLVYTGLDDVHIQRIPFSVLVTSGTTDLYQVKLHFAKYNGSGTLNVNNSNSHSVITIQEIQT